MFGERRSPAVRAVAVTIGSSPPAHSAAVRWISFSANAAASKVVAGGDDDRERRTILLEA